LSSIDYVIIDIKSIVVKIKYTFIKLNDGCLLLVINIYSIE